MKDIDHSSASIRGPSTTFVLIHSPLIGPTSWSEVADQLRKRHIHAVVPSLLTSLNGPPPFWQHQVNAVVDAIAQATAAQSSGRILLVAHSGAGALLPLIRQRLPGPVSGYLFVDAGLPRSGSSYTDTLPAPALEQLHALEHDGQLPPWHDWFGGEEALSGLLPDPALRARFISELPPLPWQMFAERRPEHPEWPDAPCGYLRLSEAYDTAAADAEHRSWPTRYLESHHLAMLTEAPTVTRELLALTAALKR